MINRIIFGEEYRSLKMDLQEVGCGAWIGSSWLRIGTGVGHF